MIELNKFYTCTTNREALVKILKINETTLETVHYKKSAARLSLYKWFVLDAKKLKNKNIDERYDKFLKDMEEVAKNYKWVERLEDRFYLYEDIKWFEENFEMIDDVPESDIYKEDFDWWIDFYSLSPERIKTVTGWYQKDSFFKDQSENANNINKHK